MPREELRSLQLERLRRQLERCSARSSLHREKCRAYGAEPEDIASLEDFEQFPVVTKEELRRVESEHPPFGTFVVAGRNS